MTDLPRPTRASPGQDDPRNIPVLDVINKIVKIIMDIRNIRNPGEFSLFRHMVYEMIKVQGESGAILNELECPVCYERFNLFDKEPVINTCGHTYCRGCFNGIRSCCVCRSTKGNPIINYKLKDILEKLK